MLIQHTSHHANILSYLIVVSALNNTLVTSHIPALQQRSKFNKDFILRSSAANTTTCRPTSIQFEPKKEQLHTQHISDIHVS